MTVTPLVLAALALSAQGSVPTHGPSAEQADLLRRADVGTTAPPRFRALLRLSVSARPGGGHIEVWRSVGARTLVRFLDPSERGKYLLYRDREVWFLAPGSRNPVRLPPSFRLRGSATLDDVLGRHYSRDFATRSAEEKEAGGHAVVEFHLEPLTPGSPYASVLYVVRRASALPERAEFRLRSGRLATVLEFAEWSPGARLRPRRLILRDALRGGAVTEVEVRGFEERDVPDGLFDLKDGSERRRLSDDPRP